MITYDEFIQTYSYSDKIPKYIYKTAKFDFSLIPDKFICSINRSKKVALEYVFVYFSDTDCINFIQQYFPEYFDDYQNIIPGAYRADIFRLLILYKFGGIYSDICQEFVSDMNDILFDFDHVFVGTGSNALFNAFMASMPNSQIIKKMIEQVMNNVKNKSYADGPLDITGPFAIGKAYNKYLNKNQKETILPGNYNYLDNNIQILLLEIDNNCRNYYRQGYITNLTSKLIQSKFDNCLEIGYSNTIHYSESYANHKVYETDIC